MMGVKWLLILTKKGYKRRYVQINGFGSESLIHKKNTLSRCAEGYIPSVSPYLATFYSLLALCCRHLLGIQVLAPASTAQRD